VERGRPTATVDLAVGISRLRYLELITWPKYRPRANYSTCLPKATGGALATKEFVPRNVAKRGDYFARADSGRLVTSYAGFSEESDTLKRLYHAYPDAELRAAIAVSTHHAPCA
jgi:hypothetical protein